MDCAITSLFPGAGGPPPATPDSQAGSAAELAALFAALVDDLAGAAPNVPAGPTDGARAAESGVEEASEPSSHDEEAASSPFILTPAWLEDLPPQTSAGPVPQNAAASTGRAADGAIPGSAPAADVPGPVLTPDGSRDGLGALTSSNAAEAVEAESLPTAVMSRPASAGGESSADIPARGEASTKTAAGDWGQTGSPRVTPAAAALARTLAALIDGGSTGTVASESAGAAPAAPGAPTAPGSPNARIATETMPTLPPAVRGGASAVDLPKAPTASTVPVDVAAGAETAGEFQTGSESGHGTGSGTARPADLPTVLSRTSSAGASGEGNATVSHSVLQPADAAQKPALGLDPAADSGAGDEADVRQQIIQAIRLRHADGGGEARLRLTPAFLGEVRIDLKVSGDRVSAVLHVERDDVRQQIEGNTAALRAALAAQGLTLDELTVREDGSSRRDQTPDQQKEHQPPRRRRMDPSRHFELPD